MAAPLCFHSKSRTGDRSRALVSALARVAAVACACSIATLSQRAYT
jgi:hypothetical protein